MKPSKHPNFSERYCMLPCSTKSLFFNIIAAIVISSFSANLSAQQIWKRNYHIPNAYIKGFDATESYDKGYMMVGTLENATTSQLFGWFAKTDINGIKLWDKIIGHSGGTDLLCMTKTADGGAITGGMYYHDNNPAEAYVMKFNACAEAEWCTMLPDVSILSENSIIQGIVQLPDGSFICERVRFGWENSVQSVIKLGKSGTIQWINTYDTNPDYNGQWDNSLILSSDTSILVAGVAYDTIFPGYPYISTFPHFYKINASGELLWEQKWYIDPFQFCGEPVTGIQDRQGNFYCGGYKLFNPNQPYIYKLSGSGDTLYSFKALGHPQAIGGFVNSLGVLNDTTLFINSDFYRETDTIYSWAINLTDTLGHVRTGIFETEDIWDLLVFKTSDHKIIMKANAYENYTADPFNVLLYKFNSNLEYDSIYTKPFVYDSLCNHQIVRDTIAMPGICLSYVSLPEMLGKGNSLKMKVFPNPASDFITIEIPEYSVDRVQLNSGSQNQYRPLSGELLLNVVDFNGKNQQTVTFDASQKNKVLDIQNLSAGIYLLQLTQKGKIIASAKFVKTSY